MYSFEKKIVVGKVYIWIYLSLSKSVKVFLMITKLFFIPSPTKLRRDIVTLPSVLPSVRPSFRGILVNTLESTSFNGF